MIHETKFLFFFLFFFFFFAKRMRVEVTYAIFWINSSKVDSSLLHHQYGHSVASTGMWGKIEASRGIRWNQVRVSITACGQESSPPEPPNTWTWERNLHPISKPQYSGYHGNRCPVILPLMQDLTRSTHQKLNLVPLSTSRSPLSTWLPALKAKMVTSLTFRSWQQL